MSVPHTLITGHSTADDRTEQVVGMVLRLGVLIAAAVTLAGGVLYLIQYGATRPDYHTFHGQLSPLRSLADVARGVAAGNADAIVQAGVVLLIATPIARVALTLVAFAMRKDRLYALISALVLALLAYGLLGG
ncbi:MAG TPA: DUF1634 domain-containing protein [Gemmatimonadaceae bacterium]|nr:DUF1634 domain-containing protein [Gemmatimonadaceae bacterium]